MSEYTPEKIANKFKMEYQYASGDEAHKLIEGIIALCTYFQEQQKTIRHLLEEAAQIIYRRLEIGEVSIGLKHPDGIFRYEITIGHRKEVEKALKTTTYTEEDFRDTSVYKGHMISNYTEMHFLEDEPYTESEKSTYNLPLRIGLERHSFEDSLEGDYIDTYIYGPKKELLGWIEYSCTKKRTLPPIKTIKYIELIASIIGMALKMKEKLE